MKKSYFKLTKISEVFKQVSLDFMAQIYIYNIPTKNKIIYRKFIKIDKISFSTLLKTVVK